MKYLRYTYFLLIALLVFSCYDDKGNYSYTDLPEFGIDSLDVYNYVKLQEEILEISPVVKYQGDEADLEYLWTVRLKVPVYNDVTNSYPSPDTLSEEKNLSYSVNLAVNQYIVDFTIYNKVLDIKKFMSFNLDVQSDYSKGWMLLISKDGGDDIDFIKTNKFFSDVAVEDEKVYKNLYSVSNDKKLVNGKFLVQDYLSNGGGNIYVFEENGGAQLSTVDLAIKTPYEKLYSISEDITKPTAIGFTKNMSRIIIDDEKVYCRWNSATFESSLIVDDKGYEAASFVLSTTGGDAPVTVIYDKLNRRFLQIPLFSKKTGVYEDAVSGALFDMNNIGMDVIHMEKGFNGYAYNIFKEPGTVNHHLYVVNIETGDQAPVAKYSMKNCTDIASATCFAFGTRGDVCYYTVDNKIYQYNYSVANDSDLEHEFAAGEKVVSMKIYKDMAEEKDPLLDSRVLVVATYNESSKAGKVYMFDVNETNGAVSGEGVKSYDVDGKVIDMGIKK